MAEISAAFPYESHFVEVHGSKMHYIEQGEGDPILFLHGNPTSSYLWRNVIPHVSSLGRCIAPDLIGMGKSDKPDIEYRFVDHIHYMDGFIEALGLKNLTLAIHDWGSGLGFYYASRHEANVKGIAFMEAILGARDSWDAFPEAARELFQSFRTPDLGWELIGVKNVFVETVLPGSVVRGLTEEEMNHYREPYLEPKSRKPIWRWPNELPIEGEPKDVVKIVKGYNRWLQETDLPKLLITAQPGAIVQKDLAQWCEKNMKNLTVVDIGPGSHFIQEDNPHGIGEAIAQWRRKLD